MTKRNAKQDKLELRYIPLSQVRLWDRNAKLHDFGSLMQSIQTYGYKDPAKFEPELNDGNGGIVEGNGRSEVLQKMKADGIEPPRGVVAENGEWLVPVLFGVDAESQKIAEAYGIDHNNITMLSGDFDVFDISKIWDEKSYKELIEGSDFISINANDKELFLSQFLDFNDYSDEFDLELSQRKEEGWQIMSFTFTNEQAEFIKSAISKIIKSDKFLDEDFGINKNRNGNAIYFLIKNGFNC